MSQIIITSPTTSGGTTLTYASFYDTTNQFQAVANNNLPITFNTQDLNGGIDLPSPTQIQVHADGVYNFTFSIQFVNTNVADQDVNIFIAKNGLFLSNSNSKISVPSSHGGTDGHTIFTMNYFLELVAENFLQIYWNTSSIDVSVQTLPVVPIPPSGFTPLTPSIIATINQIS
jgi:hypothetical protein